MVTVEYLLNNSFSTLSPEKKLEIKNEGRPTPNLSISQITKSKSREFKRSFNCDIYKKHEWLCGCSKVNRLFCFPCILFSRKSGDNNWVQKGINDLAHLNLKIKMHEKSTSHISSHLSLNLLGKQDIRQQLSSAYRLSIKQFNETVAHNRYILSKIIDCIKFCGAFELALRGHNEKSDSVNPGIFRGLINFSSELDDKLKIHIEKSTVFKGLSKVIQNDMLDCMLFVIRQKIKKEIQQSDFFSIIADETTDISSQFQMSIVFRYILSDGTPVERFWGFFIPSGHDAKSLSDCIKDNLKEVSENTDKLISQSYDGAAVMSGRFSGVQKLIRDEYKYAHFVHCYAHQLNLILSKATTQNRDVRIFFSNLTDITNFFSNSPQRVAILDKIVNHRIPRSSNTRWNFKSRIINTVYENHESIIECFEEIENTFNQNIAINQAGALRRLLNDNTFIFWLNVFHRLMPHVDILYNQLQKRTIDPIQVNNAINKFKENIQNERNNFSNEVPDDVLTSKRKRSNDTNVSRNAASKEICDVFISSVQDRFEYKDHLFASYLFISPNFPSYEKHFPQQYFDKTIESYPVFDNNKLETELKLIYKRTDFRDVSGAVNLLKFIIDNNLQSVFSESYKLILIIATIPMTSAEAERSFSTLKRIKTFLRNTMVEERLNALAMLSIEKSMINEMSNFNEEVIKVFIQKKDRRIDLVFKNVTD